MDDFAKVRAFHEIFTKEFCPVSQTVVLVVGVFSCDKRKVDTGHNVSRCRGNNGLRVVENKGQYYNYNL